MIGVPIFSTTITASRLTSRSAASSISVTRRPIYVVMRGIDPRISRRGSVARLPGQARQ
jgi:hypothetical protein